MIVRNVFSRDEVERMRDDVETEAAAAKRSGRIIPRPTDDIIPVGDLADRAMLGNVLLDKRVLDVARELLRTDDLVYFGDSSISYGLGGRGFHKDNAGRYDASHVDWAEPYGMVRFAIYLQDTDRASGGLKVRAGSHVWPDATHGSIVNLDARAGDLVAWNMRLTHSGNAVRLRYGRDIALPPAVEDRLPALAIAPSPLVRMALFLAFAREGEHLKAYVSKHANLDKNPDNYLYVSWLHSSASDSFSELAASVGVRLLRPVSDYGSLYGRPDFSREQIARIAGERVPELSWRARVARKINSLRGQR